MDSCTWIAFTAVAGGDGVRCSAIYGHKGICRCEEVNGLGDEIVKGHDLASVCGRRMRTGNGKIKSVTTLATSIRKGSVYCATATSNWRNTMSARTRIVVGAAAIGVLIAPALACAQARNAGPGASAAATKSSRATRPAQRGRVSQDSGASARRVPVPDDRRSGADPDTAIRFQLRRDSMGM